MTDFWVIDTICTALPTSSLEQDGSDYYYNRAVVPANSKEQAIAQLTSSFSNDGITINDILNAVVYEQGDWSNDIYQLDRAYTKARQENRICSAAFISSDVYNFKYKDKQ